MPPGIAGIVWTRKTVREGAKTVTRTPTPFADDLIERGLPGKSRHSSGVVWFQTLKFRWFAAIFGP